MAFLTVSEESVQKEGASSYATTSGIYDVNLKGCEIKSTTNGATQANYMSDKFMSYNNTVIDTQGKPIFGFRIMEALSAVIGEPGLSDPEATEIKFKNSTKELMCIPELTNVDVKVWVQFSYRLWDGQIQEGVSVKRFYRQLDGASGSEVLSNKDIGVQLAKDEKYASEVKYEDGLDGAKVDAWKKEQADARSGQASASTPAAGNAGAAKPFPGT